MFSIEAIVRVVIYAIVCGLIFWLLHWLIHYINPPEPFKKFAVVFLAVAAVLVLISLLLSLVGFPVFVR